jgi:hypothetical protein
VLAAAAEERTQHNATRHQPQAPRGTSPAINPPPPIAMALVHDLPADLGSPDSQKSSIY